jgi:hypothetical protein
MSLVRAFTSQYKQKSKSQIIIRNPNANRYWVQHKLNAMHMTKLLLDRSISFADRADLTQAIAAAERKVAYWERHENFDLASASIVFRAARKVEIQQFNPANTG